MPNPLSVSAAARRRSSYIKDAFAPLWGLFVLGWGTNQFAPLLLFYPEVTPVSPVEVQGLFVLYGLTLIPALLLGGSLSDRFGRSAIFISAMIIAGMSSITLLWGGVYPAAIVIARILIGLSCGIGFSAGTAWVTELLIAPKGSRLALIFMTGGMGVGSLAVGLLASQVLRFSISYSHMWVMVPHMVLVIFVLILLFQERANPLVKGGDEKTGKAGSPVLHSALKLGLRDPRFVQFVLPLAPWTLFCTAVPLAILPSNVPDGIVDDPLLLSAFLTPLPALGGILIQPLGGRAKVSPLFLGPLALLSAMLSLILSIVSLEWQSVPLLIVSCFIFGLAHGLCQITGLRIIVEISPPRALGRMTAVFQSLSYIGFLSPLPIALLLQRFSLTGVLMGCFVLASFTMVWLFIRGRLLTS